MKFINVEASVLTRFAAIALMAMLATAVNAQKNVLQPGDPIIASSANSPGSEGVANAIDGKPTKYLNRDSANNAKPSGFVVTPSIGVTRVVGMAMQSANDAVDRDPKVVTLEGSNDATISDFTSGKWDLITKIGDIPSWPSKFPGGDRFQTQTFFFDNFKAYKHYRWTVLETQGPSTCCFQIAEVQLLGGLLPQDVTQPGDPVIASSANSPGSEGVANAIDGKPTKYLNRDSANNAKVSGLVVSPTLGRTLVTGLTMQSANDAVDRDPKVVTLEGSNDATVSDFNSGKWEMITKISDILSWPSLFPGGDRFQTQTFLFDNYKPYRHYRWTVLETQGPSTCCFQIAEVELLGTGAPKDVTQPGDPVIASSANSPGSEGVANAIDGKPTKYLNRDSANNAKTSGFIVTPSVGATTVIGLAMQSANDAVDRDPKVVTLEGSNDASFADFNSGNWELVTRIDNIPSWPSLFPGGDRFQTQEFYFANKKSYKSYRWTVVETQGPSTCCFQIAEVEFLAVTEGADCNKARFLTQPVDTPVLEGSKATFSTVVNGPWPLQWLKNGQPISGATSTSFTTDAVTAANAADVYSVKIVGCEESVPVKATIFKPSTTKSIGIHFRGGGANGAPGIIMLTNDISGIHLQSFWNIAPNAGTGTFPNLTADPPVPLLDSDNKESTIVFDWQTTGTWGAGTGDASATQRMLNGTIGATGPGNVGTLTFSNVPDGSHAVLVYVVSPPLQFQNVSYKISGPTSKTYYIRAMNSDEYNAAPGFYRGLSTDVKNPTVADFVRFDDVRPVAGTITLEVDVLTAAAQRTGVNAIQLVLNAPSPGAPPAITADPQPTVAAAGATATLSVAATGADLTYQWRKNGRNLPNGGNISGATSPTLRVSSFSAADEGVYNVAVFNAAGSVVSKNVSVRVSKFEIQEALVGYWKFDETSGSTAANAAAGGKPGSVNGAAAWTKGQLGNALSFDGGSTYVKVDDYTKAKNQIGGSGWVNVAAGTASDVAFIRNAQGGMSVGVGQGGFPAGQFELGLAANADDGSLRLTAAIGAGPNIIRATAPTAFPLGSWQHVAFSADGAQLRLYLNGAEVASTPYVPPINPPEMAYLSIGARLNLADPADPASVLGLDTAAPNLLGGQLDDLALWTRGLSSEEVSLINAAGKGGQALTTVKITPPAAAPTLAVARTATGLKLTFTGTLQSADSVIGQWTDVAGAASPLDVTAAGGAKFYRAKQ